MMGRFMPKMMYNSLYAKRLPIGQKEILFNEIPPELSYMNRGAPLNGKFTIIFLKKNHITLQYIHSYPNGNQSSWFRKTNYYLKRIN